MISMKTFLRIINLSLILAVASVSILSCQPKDKYISFSGHAQGGTYTVKVNLNGNKGMVKESPKEIKSAVDSILASIDNSISGYNKGSILSRFNSGIHVIPDNIFIDIYRHGYNLYEETEGIVDVASGPIFDLWGFGFKSGELPDKTTVEATRKSCGMGRLKKDIAETIGTDGTICGNDILKSEHSTETTPVLNYNAIAQGYSCDLVADYLTSIGIKDMLVDIGEIFCSGLNPSGMPWTLAIDKPIDGNNDLGAHIQGIFRAPAGRHGIVTSGNYRKFRVSEGKKYAHSIDPRTGRPVEHNLLSATIVAPDALTADAYATYCMVVGLKESQKLLTEREDLEGCLIYDDNGNFCTWCSEGFILEEL